MTYREVVEALKATTKKGVSLLIARYFVFFNIIICHLNIQLFIQFRPVVDPPGTNKTNIVSEKEISKVS